MSTFLQTIWWFIAFAVSAIVTYTLPGTNDEHAWVDAMGIMISLGCFVMGCMYGIFTLLIAHRDATIMDDLCRAAGCCRPYLASDRKRAKDWLKKQAYNK